MGLSQKEVIQPDDVKRLEHGAHEEKAQKKLPKGKAVPDAVHPANEEQHDVDKEIRRASVASPWAHFCLGDNHNRQNEK